MFQTIPTLILHPMHRTTADIMHCFALGKPLSPDQTNYLAWHQTELSNAQFDPILKYYLKALRHPHHDFHTSFLLPHEVLNRESIELLKKRIAIMLKDNKAHRVVMHLSHKQFLEFKKYTTKELIFWHGNHFLTGDAFYPSGLPPVIIFQWGNYFGIVKYTVLAGEKSIMGNLLLYFEEMQERSIDRCVTEYQKRMQEEIKLQNTLLASHQHFFHPDEKPIKTPELSVSKSYLIDFLPTLRP